MAELKHDVEHFIASGFDGTIDAAKSVGREAQDRMRRNAPWKDMTGASRRELHSYLNAYQGTTKIKIVLALESGRWRLGHLLEKGTRAHGIPVPRKGDDPQAAAHPLRFVRHPGAKPFPIVDPTADWAADELASRIEKAWLASWQEKSGMLG
jgi:hypothetical protein